MIMRSSMRNSLIATGLKNVYEGETYMKLYKRKIIILLLCITAAFFLFAVCVYLKIVKVNQLIVKRYPVQGIDVSHFQGEIDWGVLQNQGIDFAYIKATEGSSHVDEKFADNWTNALQTTMRIGAYHFFSFDSEGERQAANYIQTVGKLEGNLIPVVDVEYYGDKEKNPPPKEQVISELTHMLQALEQEYGVKPMLYTTYTVYYKYLSDSFTDYPLWIRNVYFSPNINLINKWTLWQYSDTDVLKGYQGDEKYIDRNVYCADRDQFQKDMVVFQ